MAVISGSAALSGFHSAVKHQAETVSYRLLRAEPREGGAYSHHTLLLQTPFQGGVGHQIQRGSLYFPSALATSLQIFLYQHVVSFVSCATSLRYHHRIISWTGFGRWNVFHSDSFGRS